MTQNIRLIFASTLCFGLSAFGCAAVPDEGHDPIEEVTSVEQAAKGGNKAWCAIKCAAPPEGCVYEGAVTSGPCHKLTCGDLVCTDGGK